MSIDLSNSETALGCFQVISYVNAMAIGAIFKHNWVPQQCVVTSLQTHRNSNEYFVRTFSTIHASSLHLTFPFASLKPTTHFNNWSRSPVSPINTFNPRYTHSSIHWFLFPVRPKFTLSFCWVLFWYFLFFSCSSIFLCCVYWDLGLLGCECLFIYALRSVNLIERWSNMS